MKKKVLFLCTGNYYRSKFAEIYFNFNIEKYNKGWRAFSRGFYLENPENIGWISIHATKRLKELGIFIPKDGDKPKMLKVEELGKADLIIALNEKEHRLFIRKFFPEWENNIRYWNISDKQDVYPDIAMKELREDIDLLISNLN